MNSYLKMSPDQLNKSSNGDQLSFPAQARQHARAAVAELARIIENTMSDAARLAAISILLDRGLGKPPKPLDIAIKDRVKPAPPLSEEEAAEYYRRLRLNPWSKDVHDDVNLAVSDAGIPNTPKAVGEG
jgi:hypothetical protein